MAALLVVGGFVCGVLAAYLVMSELRDRERRAHVEGILALRSVDRQNVTDDPILATMFQRLLDAALPTREEAVEDEGPVGSPAEYEPPPPQVQDWTDPFFGIERELVGGLSPGQAIPGIGPDADISAAFNQAHDDHPLARGFEPEDLPVEREAGDALFEEWMSDNAE